MRSILSPRPALDFLLTLLVTFLVAVTVRADVVFEMPCHPDLFATAPEDWRVACDHRWFPGEAPAITLTLSAPRGVQKPVAPLPDAAQRFGIHLIPPGSPSRFGPQVQDAQERLAAMAVPDRLVLEPQSTEGSLMLARFRVTVVEPHALPPGQYTIVVLMEDSLLLHAVNGEPWPRDWRSLKFDIGPPRNIKEDLQMHFRRGESAGRDGRWGDALLEADAMLALPPPTVRAHLLRCEALARLGRATEARGALAAAFTLIRAGSDPYFEFERRMRPDYLPEPIEEQTRWAREQLGLEVSDPAPPAPGE